ncbi:LLM class flavin-dependent oxidoreductase [Streptomyces iconiensis]|uniref:LLM class flavin-dependent oxidoreductase n=1 Tax=Streptomyces iconiensis TaxID=1384038 RepID=A0ABT7A3H9_9ACTN|nr:LLM class flavin-dependent oxidoreductase [Streptomyces iconiensis]MDJ1135885.1 LLM class flavin-dependent oxidoreductase [Streptomyces iconiensis]
MKFGAFIAPYHSPDGNPTRQLRRDLELVEHLDRLGFDEAWIGEHHSGGYEIIASPEVFIAAAAERTRRIRLGTGVNSLPYHQPLMLADRIRQLEHQTMGRVMLGAGPGQLPSDAFMMGIGPARQRDMMGESLDALVPLLRGEVVTASTDWYELNEARLQLPPYAPGGTEIAVASTLSPAGAHHAGRHGLALLSLAAGDPAGFATLATNWDIHEATAAEHGHTADREGWRLVTPVHLAETREQARAEAEWGVLGLVRYIEGLSGRAMPWGASARQALEQWTTDGFPTFGVPVIGTPEDAIARIEQLAEKTGGFGTFLVLALNVAEPTAALRSFELFAEYVVPHFTGANGPRAASLSWANAHSDRFIGALRQAVDAAVAQHRGA